MNSDDRAKLHQELDALLDRRAALEKTNEGSGSSLGAFLGLNVDRPGHEFIDDADHWQASLLLRDMITFTQRIAGYALRDAVVRRSYRTGSQAREVLASWISLVRPILQLNPRSLLQAAPGRELTTFGVEHALKALTAGEVQPIFEPIKGKNRRANRYSLAQAKLDALLWEKRLKALGHHTKEAKHKVTVAFGEQWDTIRKWHNQCQEILGEDAVRFSLEFAGGPHDSLVHPRGIRNALAAYAPDAQLISAGNWYKRQRSLSAELSKSKRKGLDE